MAANFCVYYAIWAMLGTYLQKELGWTPAQVAVPVFWGNIITFLASSFWGAVSEKVGRRWALMIPTTISIFIAPLYLSTTDPTMFLILFMLMICFVGGKDALNPGWLSNVPDRGPGDGGGLRVSPGCGVGCVRRPGADLFRDQSGAWASPSRCCTARSGPSIVYVIAVYL